MAEKEKPKSPEELRREIALKNLKAANLMNVAAAYIVHKSGQFGTAGDAAMAEYKYFPSFGSGLKAYNPENGEELDVLKSSILASREDGQLYSGNVSELGIMKQCAGIMQESLNGLKISDIMKAMGSKASVKDGYLSSLLPKMSEEQLAKLSPDQKKAFEESMNIYQTIVGSYQSYLATSKVSEALAESAKNIPKGLEKLLATPEKGKK